MEIENLIETLVREVIKQMGKTGNLAGIPAKEKVRILGSREMARDVIKALGEEYTLLFDGEAGQCQRHILPRLSCTLMADLAAGRATDDLGQRVLNLALDGRGVEVFEFEYKAFEKTAPAPLMALYQGYEKTLRGFGIKALNLDCFEGRALTKALVTEKDVHEMVETGIKELRILKRTLVTPLALEAAREAGLEILKQGEMS